MRLPKCHSLVHTPGQAWLITRPDPLHFCTPLLLSSVPWLHSHFTHLSGFFFTGIPRGDRHQSHPYFFSPSLGGGGGGLMCTGALPVCLSVNHVCSWCPWSPAESIRSPASLIPFGLLCLCPGLLTSLSLSLKGQGGYRNSRAREVVSSS